MRDENSPRNELKDIVKKRKERGKRKRNIEKREKEGKNQQL